MSNSKVLREWIPNVGSKACTHQLSNKSCERPWEAEKRLVFSKTKLKMRSLEHKSTLKKKVCLRWYVQNIRCATLGTFFLLFFITQKVWVGHYVYENSKRCAEEWIQGEVQQRGKDGYLGWAKSRQWQFWPSYCKAQAASQEQTVAILTFIL